MKKQVPYIVLFFIAAYIFIIIFSNLTTTTLTRILNHKDHIVELKDNIRSFQILLLSDVIYEGSNTTVELEREFQMIEKDLNRYVNTSVYNTLEKLNASITINTQDVLNKWSSLNLTQALIDGQLTKKQNDTLQSVTEDLDEFIFSVDTITKNQIKVFQTFYFFLLGMFVFTMVYLVGMRREVLRRRNAEKVAHVLSQKLITLRDQERNKIAFELHDNIAQELSASLIQNENGYYTSSYQKTKDALNKIRLLSHQLFTHDIGETGLSSALERVLNDVSQESNIDFELSMLGVKEENFSNVILQNVYQVCREAIINIGKHSKAQSATVKLTTSYPFLIILIQDNGAGFDVEKVISNPLESGIGLHSIRRRVEYLNGTVDIKSSFRGTRVYIKIPFSKE